MKPPKPSADFPLFSHACGKWAKKVNGSLRYFGSWKNVTDDDPDGSRGALAEYERFVADRDQTRVRTITLELALNTFLDAKHIAVESGRIAHRTYLEHQRTCARFAQVIGKRRDVMSLGPDDFAAFQANRAKSLNLVSLGNEIVRVRTAFKWLYENRMIAKEPHYGPEFKRPGRRAIRRHQRMQGKKLFAPAQIRLLLDEAGLHLRAMILLGINCGYGPGDCADLPMAALDLDRGWSDYPRPKTEVDRLCPLWPETVEAIRASVDRRPEPDDAASPRVFVQYSGKPYTNYGGELSKYFTAVRRRLLQVPDGGFYWLRHTFATVGGGAKDQIAVNTIMGHVDDTMAAVYREEIEPERLLAVTEHVRAWLFEKR
ncbi:MAG: tyrosine-type recombinase/integrase [Planctomycetota bacterium]